VHFSKNLKTTNIINVRSKQKMNSFRDQYQPWTSFTFITCV
jgi:hypothetical protein